MKLPKQKRIRYFLLGMLVFFAFTTQIRSQVTIGSGNKPKDYAILQIDGTGGLRLPRLTATERKQLENNFGNKDNAKGLIIYFDDQGGPNSCFQFWDGAQWISMRYMNELVSARNGITETKQTLPDKTVKVTYELGGTLTENTEILQPKDKLLRFNPATGSFTVMHNALVITDDHIGVGRTPSKTALLEITGEKEKAFRYKTDDVQANYVLSSDAYGYAKWVDLKPKAELTSQPIKAENIASTTSTPKEISDPLSLEPGIWLIMARYVARSNTTASADWGYNAWLSLKKVGESEEIVRVGQVPQLMTAGTMPGMTATPQLVYMLNVPVKGDYVLYGSLYTPSSLSMTIATDDATVKLAGKSYFQAIRLSDDPN